MTHPTTPTPTRAHHLRHGKPAHSRQTAERYVLAAAGAVIVALTAGAFWLSYAHLAEVAGQHGLGHSPVRRWAWPSTLDAFIVAGELLMLRAGLRGVTDRWAVALTGTGALGSIALNVAGVAGTDSARPVPLLDYVVAAVPPTAALLAFGVLMRQIHQLVDPPEDQPLRAPGPQVTPPVRASEPPEQPPAAVPDPVSSSLPSPDRQDARPQGGRPAKATIHELVEIGRAALAEHGTLSRALLREAVEDQDLTIGSERQTEVMTILRPEIETAHTAGPDSG
ncbi:DUF2637 domain-containing protein [Streptomyces sp. NPDC093252]|uniref:DUF2637 domain-containing protein n=1 Tax=Streptomyces sp. NPDC093252 TaxID=3154980 RepID=UPI00341A41FE